MSVLFIDKPGGSGAKSLLDIGKSKTARRGIVGRMRNKRKTGALAEDKENAPPGKRANSDREIRGKYRINILFLNGFE